eukprot:462861_1
MNSIQLVIISCYHIVNIFLLFLIIIGQQRATIVLALQPNDFGSPQTLDVTTICTSRTPCEVELDVPVACVDITTNTSTCPIVFHLHGAGGSINGFKGSSGVHEFGLIGVYPQGVNGWNTGPKNTNVCDWDDFTCTDDPDESDFIAKIITEIRSLGANGNLYANGNSNGAALAHRLAVNANDNDLPFNGIVTTVTQLLSLPPRSGPGILNYNQPGLNGNTRKVSVLNIMGTNDLLVPYDGGSSGVFGGNDNFQLMSSNESNIAWAKQNGCNTVPRISIVTSSQPWGTADYYSYDNCNSGHYVEHYKVYDGNHGTTSGTVLNGKTPNELQYKFIWKVENSTTSNIMIVSPTILPSITICICLMHYL